MLTTQHNINSTTVSNVTQTLYPNYPTLIPVIPGKQIHFETKKEQVVKYYNELIYTIMKAIEIQYVTHCTEEGYKLITIHGAGDMLIYIIPSKTLSDRNYIIQN